MAWNNKVVWSEGMFLRPQHFQQFDRWVEGLVRGRSRGLRPYGWGLSAFRIDHQLLETGRFAVTEVRGVLEDGTPFSIPDDVEPPPPIELPENTRDCIVYLALPITQPGGAETMLDDDAEIEARYLARDYEAVDSIAGSEATTPLRVGRMRLRYRLATDDLEGYTRLGLARISEVEADRRVRLDDKYIPPVMACDATRPLAGFLTELQGLLNQRAEALAARVSQAGTRGVAEIADFLRLQVLNRYEPVVAHYGTAADIHPETLFTLLIQLAGELSTFDTTGRRPPRFPAYRHDDLAATFRPVIDELRHLFSVDMDTSAIALELRETKSGVRVSPITDRSLLGTAGFVLAVKADVPAETVRRHFPHQIKIAPVEDIRQIVNSALPGIELRALPVAPRQVPYHAGFTYFELEKSGHFWKRLANSGGFALHVGGDYPGLELEFWAIKS